MSFDAGTFGPGLRASVLALILPVLFVISFIVPGVLVLWEMLRQEVWQEVR